MNYEQFLERKRLIDPPSGMEPGEIHAPLYDFQKDIVRWALRRGRAACFADCGLGKTLMQLEWSRQVALKTGKPVLILAPPSVREQTRGEGLHFGILCNVADGDEDIQRVMCPDMQPHKGVFITNYEKLHRFDPSKFSGVAIDESSCLKAYDSKTRGQVISMFRQTPYKSAWTATPAPNDYMELGNHSEFIGAMTRSEMLSMFFTHDGGDTSKWRLKKHAGSDYWSWLCSWSVSIRAPSDLGYDDDGFTLPDFVTHEHIVGTQLRSEGMLFPMPASTLSERRAARRGSINERCAMVEAIARKGKRQVHCLVRPER